ncbi:MAG: hypothetical protein WCP89_00055 [archaeon]
MSLKEIEEGMKEGKVMFGLKEFFKHSSAKGKGKIKKLFVVKDARPATFKKLGDANIEFEMLKDRMTVKHDLNLDFECEVFSLK